MFENFLRDKKYLEHFYMFDFFQKMNFVQSILLNVFGGTHFKNAHIFANHSNIPWEIFHRKYVLLL